ncbi:MAG: ArnT family glycosyltransferase [Terracidiphilus sp.]
MSQRSDRIPARIAEVSLVLTAGACLALLLVRIYYAISFVTPYLLATTGYEWENLYSVWKITQHLPVYTDPHGIPFTVSYYNWAYYYFYGWITNACLHLFHLDAVWIATIGRIVSLAFTVVTGIVFWLTGREFVKTGFFSKPAVAWAWSLIAATSPLVGFWSITVRSDIGALAFEAAGLYVFLRYLRHPDHRLIVAAALLFYAAWSFKQSSVTMLAGSALTLLLCRRWRAFFTLSAIWWALVVVTLVVGGPLYRENILFSQQHLPMTVSLGLTNALRAFGKNPFLLLCLAVIAISFLKRLRDLASRPIEAALTLVALFSFCFALVTSCKAGANDNYFIPAAWAAMLGFALLLQGSHSRWIPAGLAVCSVLSIGAIALSPTGLTYYYNYRIEDPPRRAVAEKLRHLPSPVFVVDPYSDLPWVQPNPPYFVVPDTYRYDRDAGVPLEDGGWEGLARAGYFGTLVFYENGMPAPQILEKYELVDVYRDGYHDLNFYRRIDPDRR